ncbi:uncharacterized protein LOC121390748 [Gigantopelta aegis]|uniref:uncharacterized protein LOC121390748 n=1 Tax=Gigantopelta aegis TaxID=1735272 RepID=UPI001B88E5D4|nr:uncharacterized protein LOC121390748 [Gigantopelta aegis]
MFFLGLALLAGLCAVVPEVGGQAMMGGCQYLSSQKSRYPINTAPFELLTRSKKKEVTRGWPIEVSIKPWNALPRDNFTDFIVFATDANALDPAMGPGPVGVFAIHPYWSRGASGFRCTRSAQGYDGVGSIQHYRMRHSRNSWKIPVARRGGAFLWFPSESAMALEHVLFVGHLNIGNQWYKIESRLWKVHNPPPVWQTWTKMMTQIQAMKERSRAMERQAESAGAAGV